LKYENGFAFRYDKAYLTPDDAEHLRKISCDATTMA